MNPNLMIIMTSRRERDEVGYTLPLIDYSFLLAASATLLTPSLIAFFASPFSFCASPFASCPAPSLCILSEPTALPTPCLTFPAASLAIPAALSVFPLMCDFLSRPWWPALSTCPWVLRSCDDGQHFVSVASCYLRMACHGPTPHKGDAIQIPIERSQLARPAKRDVHRHPRPLKPHRWQHQRDRVPYRPRR